MPPTTINAPIVERSNCVIFFVKLKNKKAAPKTNHADKTGKASAGEKSISTVCNKVNAGKEILIMKLLSTWAAFSGIAFTPLSMTPINKHRTSKMTLDILVIRYWLFVIGYSLFVTRYSLLVTRYSLYSYALFLTFSVRITNNE